MQAIDLATVNPKNRQGEFAARIIALELLHSDDGLGILLSD